MSSNREEYNPELEDSPQEIQKHIKELYDEVDILGLKFEEIAKEKEILNNLQEECRKYVKECGKEVMNGLWWRNAFSYIIRGYFFCINAFVFMGSGWYPYYEPLCLCAALAHNGCILLLPLISFLRSYGERNQNDYFPPGIKKTLEIATKSGIWK